ncbi:MAG: hypothetical protein IJU50_10205, partial [Lachnospiraceae bacterium]|nr:hypothetical protein [Lachnospiraceae bacterium]
SGTKYELTLKKGGTFVLQLENVYQTPSFTSNKKNIAFVDEMGVIEARSKGKATISIPVNGKKLTVEVKVE